MTEQPQKRTSPPPFQLLLITETGRPLFHYIQPNHGNNAHTNTLSAAFAAFSATTSNTVSTVTTASHTLLISSKPPLLLAISAPPKHPLTHLRALARLIYTTVYTCLSASIIPHLSNFPNFDTTSITSRLETLLSRVITSSLTNPLSSTLALLPSLPAPLNPTSYTLFTNTIRRALTRFKQVSHVLIFTASSPYPRRVITTVSPSNARFSTLDVLLLLHVPPLRSDDEIIAPDLLFLPTCAFRRGFRVALRAVKLQVDVESLDETSVPVDGIKLQSPLNVTDEKALWLVALGDWKGCEAVGEHFLDHLESLLDRSAVAKDVLVAMEKPWTVSDIRGTERHCRHVKATLMLGNERFVATVEAFGYPVAEAVLRTLELSSGSFVSHTVNKLYVVVFERKYIIVFDNDVSKEDAVDIARQLFVPWMKRFKASLMPADEGTTTHPLTPLAGFLAPFSS